jgi:hypothetical protein
MRRDRPYQAGRSRPLGEGEEPGASGDEPGDGCACGTDTGQMTHGPPRENHLRRTARDGALAAS